MIASSMIQSIARQMARRSEIKDAVRPLLSTIRVQLGVNARIQDVRDSRVNRVSRSENHKLKTKAIATRVNPESKLGLSIWRTKKSGRIAPGSSGGSKNISRTATKIIRIIDRPASEPARRFRPVSKDTSSVHETNFRKVQTKNDQSQNEQRNRNENARSALSPDATTTPQNAPNPINRSTNRSTRSHDAPVTPIANAPERSPRPP